jgi:tetratricopeptide (TPR) repeat protein
MAFLSEACASLGDVERAADLYALLVPYSASAASLWVDLNTGSIARYLGMLSTTLSRWDDAAQELEDAIAMNERMRARPWLAHTREEYARVLLRRGKPDDAPRARALADAAITTYRELGMESYAARASSLAGGSAVRAP